MTEIEIEDDVPLPDPATTRRYPFNKMKVGQSFPRRTRKRLRPLPPIIRRAPKTADSPGPAGIRRPL